MWALGIILVNVLTGRNPWERASVLDRNFVDFLAEGAAFFRTAFPELSRGACALLADVLALKPERRLSLSGLREAVEGLESFFARGEEGEEEEEVDGVTAAIAKITVEEVESAPALLSDEDEDDEDEDDLFEDLNTMEVPEEDNLPRPSGSYATRIDDEEDLVQRLERLKVRDSPEARSPTLSEEEKEQYLYLLRKKYLGKDFH